MPGLTSVFHFQFPVRGDSAKAIPGQIQTLAQQVDAALAQRAVAPDLGTAAALSSRVTALEKSTASIEVASYGTSFVRYADARWAGLRYTSRGALTTVSGAVKAAVATTGETTIATLPVGFRPPFPVEMAGGTNCLVLPDGSVICAQALAIGTIFGISAAYVALP